MLDRLLAFISDHNLLSRNETLFLAVSGGLDSMVMLRLFVLLGDRLPLNLQVLHVNHGVRPDSVLDEQLVRQTCDQLAIPFHSRTLKGFNWDTSEDRLRQARYAAFEQMSAPFGKVKIATAHHLDDQLETILMRLARGSSVRGLSGIPVERGRYIRPLLCLKRSEIEHFAGREHVPFRQDSTNADIRKMRNRIRKILVPALREVFGQDIYSGLSGTIGHVKEFVRVLDHYNEQLFSAMVEQQDDGLMIKLSDYRQLISLQRRQLLEYCISRLKPLNLKFSKKNFASFENFVRHGTTGAEYHLQTVIIYKGRNRLILVPAQRHYLQEKELFPGRDVYMGRNKISIKEVYGEEIVFSRQPGVEYICGQKLTMPLIVRSWRSGDYFYPLGLGFKQKVSDFFIDHKIERNRKYQIPIVCHGEQILWLAGLRLDNRCRVTAGCKRIYQLTCEVME